LNEQQGTNHFYALIMAGGGGTRLWPLSRKTRPKQMLPLVEERTMFQIAVERLDPLLPPEKIIVVTGRDHVEQLKSSVPQVPSENFIVEPFGRDSGPAAGLGIMHIQHRDPSATIAVLAADHHIADTPKFQRVLAASAGLAEQGYIVTLGVSPSFPSTGFGYIKRGAPLVEGDKFQDYHSAGYTEKPDAETAVQF
jgi:mannose-1-phosphate guanylyltransferase